VIDAEFPEAMWRIHAAAMYPEVRTLHGRIENVLDAGRHTHWAIVVVCCDILADVIGDAPPEVRSGLIEIIHDALEISNFEDGG
jgi:hypothetical protein